MEIENLVIKNEIPENGNQIKVIDTVKKILDFNEQQKGRRIKISTPKKMFERLPIAFAQVKVRNTSENLLTEIRQIIYSLHQAKKY